MNRTGVGFWGAKKIADHPYYSESEASSEASIDAKREAFEMVPLNTQAIRDTVQRIEDQVNSIAFEKSNIDERILETLERHSALLDSIDHAHYYKITAEAIWLGRIFWLILALVAGHFAIVIFNTW